MSRETLLKEKQSLLDWIRKIKENNPNELEAWHLVETLEEKIREIEEKIKQNDEKEKID